MGVNYNTKVIPSGLTMYLDAGNSRSYPGTGTTWNDLSGNRSTGTLTNGPTYSSSNGGSIVFDGVDDYIDCPVGILPSGTNLFTYSLWLYFNGNISGSFGGVVYAAVLMTGDAIGSLEFCIKTQSLTPAPPYNIELSKYGGGTTGSCSITGVNMPINTWHNLVLVRSASNAQVVYLNGVSIGTGNVSDSFLAGTRFAIGCAVTNSSYAAPFKGNISNIMLYNTALTAAEVAMNYAAIRGRYGV